MRRTVACGLGALAFAISFAAAAQPYPSKPVRLLAGLPAGSSLDAAARALAGRLGDFLQQQIVVDNRVGAGGVIAAEIAARARADGYTLLMGANGALAISPALHDRLPYDPVRDFAPVTLVVDVMNVLVVHPATPAATTKELIALAKSRELLGGSGGIGTPGHLALELFNMMAGTKVTHIAYKGSVPALVDLIAGSIHLSFATSATALPQMKGGKLKALGVTAPKRSVLLPDLPTVAESGLPGFEMTGWYGMLAPAGTPKAVVARLNAESIRALRAEDVRQALHVQGLEVRTSTPDAFAAHLKSEIGKWAKVVKFAGAKPQ